MDNYALPRTYPSRCDLPVLLSVPHAGCLYDTATLDRAAQGLHSLQTLEDPLVDRLAWRGVALGIGAVIQIHPRAIIDCNRGEDEVDPASVRNVSPLPVGPRARRGLGLVPSRTQRHGKLWRNPIERDELLRRIEQIHRPYHRIIEKRLDQLVVEYGHALLIDCHSMPSRPAKREKVVIGDRFGTSAAPWVTNRAAELVRQAGFPVAINDPYAGGHVTERHGQPNDGFHAIQIEIDRSTYLDEGRRTAGPAFDQVAQMLARLAVGMGQELASREGRLAAE